MNGLNLEDLVSGAPYHRDHIGFTGKSYIEMFVE